MSTDATQRGQVATPAAPPMTIKEVIAVLIRHHGFHEGKFDLFMEYQFGVGAFGPTQESVAPGVVVGLTKLGLTQSHQPGPLTVDAAEVNPKSPQRPSRARKSVKSISGKA